MNTREGITCPNPYDRNLFSHAGPLTSDERTAITEVLCIGFARTPRRAGKDPQKQSSSIKAAAYYQGAVVIATIGTGIWRDTMEIMIVGTVEADKIVLFGTDYFDRNDLNGYQRQALRALGDPLA